MVTRKSIKYKITEYIVYIIIIIFSIALITCAIPQLATHKDAKLKHRTRNNIYDIYKLIIEYAGHNHDYPDNLDLLLLNSNFMDKVPVNAYSRDRKMQNIDFKAPHTKGDFTYISIKGKESVIGFYLLGYGSRYTMDVNRDGIDDEVVIVVDHKGKRYTDEKELGSIYFELKKAIDDLENGQ